jgi:hypothetical protein
MMTIIKGQVSTEDALINDLRVNISEIENLLNSQAYGGISQDAQDKLDEMAGSLHLIDNPEKDYYHVKGLLHIILTAELIRLPN